MENNIEKPLENVTSDSETAVSEAPSSGAETIPPPSPVNEKSFKARYQKLEAAEKIFVREALREGDYVAAARKSGFKAPRELLARPPVREILLLTAPFLPSDMFARISKPFVQERLLQDALAGETGAMKMLLSFDVGKPKKSTISYSRPGMEKPGDRTESPGS